MANILIAAGAHGTNRMREILAPEHLLSFAKTMQEALDFAPNCDLMVCGLEFDESRMFDFLREVNRDASLLKKPRVCVRFIATNTPDNVIGGLEVAARAVGANALLDVPSLDDEFGANEANEKIREAMELALRDGRS